MAWKGNFKDNFIWDVIIHWYPSFDGGLTKFGACANNHIPEIYVGVFNNSCPNPEAATIF